MSEREIVDAFVEGRISQWGVFHRLRALGVSAAAALAISTALPGVTEARDLTAMRNVPIEHPGDDASLARILDQLAKMLEKAGDGSVRPLATTLARLGANNAGALNDPSAQGNLPLNVNAGNVNLVGRLNVERGNNNNLGLNLSGNIGEMAIVLDGSINLPAGKNNGANVNLGNVNLNVNGNAGNVPINLLGNLGGGAGANAPR